jgi:hypothetical protein
MALKLCDVDVSKICFGDAVTNNNGQKVVPISMIGSQFNYDSRLRFQLGDDEDSLLCSPWGLSTPMPGSDPLRRNLEFEVTPEMEEKLKAIDDFITKAASERSMAFFKTETLKKEYTPLVRVDKNGRKMVRIKVIMPGAQAKPTTVEELVDVQGEAVHRPLAAEKIGKNTQLLAVVDTQGIWSSHAQFGLSLTARGLLVRIPASKEGISMFSLKRTLRQAQASDGIEEETGSAAPGSEAPGVEEPVYD